jgi:hypothetical protein
LTIEDSDPAAMLDEGPLSVRGIVSDIEEKNGVTKISLRTECVLPVVIFDQIEVDNGSLVRVYGSLTKYKDKNEIVAEKIISP